MSSKDNEGRYGLIFVILFISGLFFILLFWRISAANCRKIDQKFKEERAKWESLPQVLENTMVKKKRRRRRRRKTSEPLAL